LHQKTLLDLSLRRKEAEMDVAEEVRLAEATDERGQKVLVLQPELLRLEDSVEEEEEDATTSNAD
jgi:hypothetical protein